MVRWSVRCGCFTQLLWLGNRLSHCYGKRLDTGFLGNRFVARLTGFQVKLYGFFGHRNGFFFGLTLRVAARECRDLY